MMRPSPRYAFLVGMLLRSRHGIELPAAEGPYLATCEGQGLSPRIVAEVVAAYLPRRAGQ